MDGKWIDAIGEAARNRGASAMKMTSGAGHDAMVVGKHIPAAMIFVPSKDGVSHNVAEDTEAADLKTGLEVMSAALSIMIENGIGQG